LYLHTYIYIICIVFILLIFSLSPPSFHQCLPFPAMGRTCSFLLFFNSVENLLYLLHTTTLVYVLFHRLFLPCDINIHPLRIHVFSP
jgi:hypothetical protein